jgi:hypothetical protein
VNAPETDAERAERLQLEEHCRVIGGLLRNAVSDLGGPRIGFALLLFNFGDGGSIAYMSNAERRDMINALEELIARLRLEQYQAGGRQPGGS